MSNYARCTHCGSDDVEATGAVKYELDEYYCHDCEQYFEIDWDEQDETDETDHDPDFEDETLSEDEDVWENEGGSY